MARKPVLEGGRRDEIIDAAEKLFFSEGFENTSVRKILAMVNGEVGMFYHYFSSKEELFDIVADRFFRRYAENFAAMAEEIRTPEDFTDVFLPSYEKAMSEYQRIEGNMHWTIRMAFHERTLLSLIPTVQKLLERFAYHGRYPLDIAAARAVADFSAVIHSAGFAAMNEKEKKQMLKQLLDDIMN